MAIYPAKNTQEASELLIDVSNQLHEIVNEGAAAEISTDSGLIPSVRKALADTFLFQKPIPWQQGETETAFNQLRTFGSNLYWAPSATLDNPITMGATPEGDNNWPLAPARIDKSSILSGLGKINKGYWDENPTLANSNEFVVYRNTGDCFGAINTPYTVDSASHPNPEDLVGTELVDSSNYATEYFVTDSIVKNTEVYVEYFGEPVTNATVNAAASSAKTLIFKPDTTYELDNITLPDGVNIKAFPTTTFKKSASGFIFDLGRRGIIEGAPRFDGGRDKGLTGNSVVISRGDNSSNKDLQGHQRVKDCSFTNSESYHVNYPNENKGWMSELNGCQFLELPTNAPANVKWPDEPTKGGNRHIIGGYSSGPVCNVSGADNGVISYVEVGAVSADLDDQFVYFDPSATNAAKKIRFIGNRPAIANGTMNVKNAADCVFSDNIFAGKVVFEAGVSNCSYSNTNIQQDFTDNSGQNNVIDIPRPEFYIPTISSGVDLGNGSIQGEYQRNGSYVDFRFEFDIGSTTNITGSMTFDLPVSTVTGTRIFTGTAWGSGYAGLSYIRQETSTVVVYATGSTPAVWNATTPKAWESGDKIVIEGRYRLF